LVADEQVASVVEVKTVFEDELFEKFWRDHPKYVAPVCSRYWHRRLQIDLPRELHELVHRPV